MIEIKSDNSPRREQNNQPIKLVCLNLYYNKPHLSKQNWPSKVLPPMLSDIWLTSMMPFQLLEYDIVNWLVTFMNFNTLNRICHNENCNPPLSSLKNWDQWNLPKQCYAGTKDAYKPDMLPGVYEAPERLQYQSILHRGDRKLTRQRMTINLVGSLSPTTKSTHGQLAQWHIWRAGMACSVSGNIGKRHWSWMGQLIIRGRVWKDKGDWPMTTRLMKSEFPCWQKLE